MKHRRTFDFLRLPSLRSCLAGLLLCALLTASTACTSAGGSDQSSSGDSSTSLSPSTTTTGSSSTTTTTEATTTTEPQPTDVTPPTVTGEDFEITEGDSVSYKKQITVVDDLDPNPTVEVDNSAVDQDTPGSYPVIYTVTDAAGNTTTLTLTLTVKEKVVAPQATEEYVLYEAGKILDEITDDSMSELQVAYSIYRWTKYNIGYLDSSDKTDWVVGAYDGFTKRRGDCFTYYSVSKALLTAAGIDNVDMVKHRTSDKQSRHYWSLVNVGEGWYHFDSTPYIFKNSNFFMVTDEELAAWDDTYYKNAHNFIADGLPERETESIQDRVNYSSSTLKY